MRYHYQRTAGNTSLYGEKYVCNHPLYDACTLYSYGGKGVAVVQQRFNKDMKYSWWGEIDSYLTDPIYLNPRFKDFFLRTARKKDENGLYPTVPLRKLMWELRMKPLKKEIWEKNFD